MGGWILWNVERKLMPHHPYDLLLITLFMVASTYLLWSCLHELSHLFIAHILVGVKRVIYFRCWPTIDPESGDWKFGCVSYELEDQPTHTDQLHISMAPSFLSFIGMISLPFIITLSHTWVELIIMGVLSIGGMIDFAVASIGHSAGSDLQQAYPYDRDRQAVRVIRWTVLATVLSVSIAVFIARCLDCDIQR